MTEEEYFRKTYPDSCYGDKPLSPYWDFFQDGVEFGERQSENKIVDIKANCDLAIEGRDIKIKELEESNKELKKLVQQREQRGLEVQEDLLKEKEELEKELKNWKDEWQEQVQKAIDEGYARTQQTIQLSKAKEILRSLYFIIQSRIDYKNNTGIADEMWRAEQFIKEIEK